MLPVLLLLFAAGALASCGGDDEEEVKALLDKAFNSSIESADVDLDVEVALDGVEQLDDPIEFTLSGPYESAGDAKIPQLDWDITVRAQNQSFNAGLVSTGDRAFVSFQGTDYEVDRRTVEAFNRQLAAGRERDGARDLSDFGVSAREWVTEPEVEGDEEIAGVETTHVSGKLDITRVLDDLNTIVAEATKLGGPIGQQAPPQLTDDQKEQVEEVVSDPSFDAYVGKDDDKLHRLSADIDFEVPEDARENVGGLEGGRVSFSIEFTDIGGDKSIETPANARPISELTEQLRGLLGGALGGGAVPEGGGAPGAGGSAPQTDEEKRKAYKDCVAADPSDPQVREFCEVLLQ